MTAPARSESDHPQLRLFGGAAANENVAVKKTRANSRVRIVNRRRSVEDLPSAHIDIALHHHHDRLWLEIDDKSRDSLAATEGDRIVIIIDGRETMGVFGTKGRVWFTEEFDVDVVESVTIRRLRRV